MKSHIIRPILTIAIIVVCASSILSDGNNSPTPAQAKPVAINNSTSPQQSGIVDKELVVVSKTPEFFTYVLSAISVVLSILIILVGIITGLGLTIVIKASRDKKEIEDKRESFVKEQEKMRQNLKHEYEKMVKALQHKTFTQARVQRAKRSLRDALSTDNPSHGNVYMMIERTVSYPDAECLSLYAKALSIFETNVDIIRVVRNGILEFSRNIELKG